MDLIDRIDCWGRETPERAAHISGGRSLTYGELLRRSHALSARLHELLSDDRAPVAIVGHKEPEMLIAFLGVIKSGQTLVATGLFITDVSSGSGST